MRIIPRSEWGARYGDGKYWRDLPAAEAWLHHSVTVAPDLHVPYDDDDRAIRTIEQIGRNRFGWTYGFPYTYGITPVGRIYEGHHIAKTGAHTAGHNRVGIGICLVGNYEDQRPTDAQLDAVAWLLRHCHAQDWLATPQLTGGHRDTKATACPGRHAYAAIDEINRLAQEDNMALSNEDMHKLFYTPMIPSNFNDNKYSLSYMIRFIDEYANKMARNVLAERPSGTPGSDWRATAAEMTTDQQSRIVQIEREVSEIKTMLRQLTEQKESDSDA